MIIAIIMKEINGRFTVRPCQRSQSMIITILLAGLLLILVAGIRCGFALDDLTYIIHGFAVKVAESHIVTTF